MTNGISAQAPTSSAPERLETLCRMLRNTLRSYPTAKLLIGKDAFGASLGEGISIWIHYSGLSNAEALRDLLALFATWCVADPAKIMGGHPIAPNGASHMVTALSRYSNGRLD